MNYRNEVYRKMIHLGSSVFPVFYYYSLSREQMLWLLGGLSALFLVGELLRMNVGPFKRFFKLIFSAACPEDACVNPNAVVDKKTYKGRTKA